MMTNLTLRRLVLSVLALLGTLLSQANGQSLQTESKFQPTMYLTAPFAVVGVNYQVNKKWGVRPMTSIVFDSEFTDVSYNAKFDVTYKPDVSKNRYFIIGAYGNYNNVVENTYLNLGIGWNLEVTEKLYIRPEIAMLTDFDYFFFHTSGVAFQFSFK